MSKNTRRWGWIWVLASVCGLAGCDDPGDRELPGDAVNGRAVYENPVEDGNTFSCESCHALQPGEGLRRPGHAIGGANRRATFKNGQLTSFADAVNSCLVEWMNAEEWAGDDPRLLDLEAFVDEAGDESEPIVFEVVQPPSSFDGGDAERGREFFNGSCAVCHGEDGVGTPQAIAVGEGTLAPDYAARRIRLSGRADSDIYDDLDGGVMPFWAADRLDDDELQDVVAWLSRSYDPDAEPEPEPDPDPDPVNPNEGCPEDHPKVGQVAQLEEFFHQVGGTAEIIDNCTIELRDFTYDGAGIDVRLYGGLGGDYDNGFPMGDDLVQPGGYAGDTLYFTIPDGRSLDDLDGVSVWCVDVGVDFGSGMFS